MTDTATIENNTLTIGDHVAALPILAQAARVLVWAVPPGYQASGYFISVTPLGGAQEIPACAPADAALVADLVLPGSQSAQLKAAQIAKWDAIKAQRDRRKFAGVKVAADWFHCDLESRGQWERMANKVNKMGLTGTAAYTIGGQPVPWKTMEGTFVVLTAGKIFAVVDAIELQEALVFGRAEQHRAAMEASADPAAYDYSTGWPTEFDA